MAIRIKTINKQDRNFYDTIKKLKDGYVKIGWYEGQREPNGLLVSENAYMQEKGFTIKQKNGNKIYVPPRPFLAITIAKYGKNWVYFWKAIYKHYLDKKISFLGALNKLGALVKSNIQTTIATSDGIRPNAPSVAKRKKGKPPLIDSGKMFNSINYHSEEGK